MRKISVAALAAALFFGSGPVLAETLQPTGVLFVFLEPHRFCQTEREENCAMLPAGTRLIVLVKSVRHVEGTEYNDIYLAYTIPTAVSPSEPIYVEIETDPD